LDIFLSLTLLKITKKRETNNNEGPKDGRKPSGLIKEIKGKTNKTYSAEEKIRIVLEGMRGEETIANITRNTALMTMCITNGARTFWKQLRND
jgi:hypothetical protein